MVRSRNSCSKTKRSFSSITLLVFHGMRLFYTQLPKFPQCQGCSRSILSGMCPVRTHNNAPPYPLFFVSVASKELTLHQNCAHFAQGGWAQARTGISRNCTQKLLYQRNRGSSRGISRNY